jgi:pimeloyl-ACP methyl ester carboxylesterase
MSVIGIVPDTAGGPASGGGPAPGGPAPGTAVPGPGPVPAPVSTTVGAADLPRRATVLSPVLPVWDEGAFFEPVTRRLLATGHRVTLWDTLSLVREGDDVVSLAARWAGVLAAHEPPDVLAGNALGGAVAQALLDRGFAARARVLLVSSPTVVDEVLTARLSRIGDLAARGQLAQARELLARRVRPAAGPDAEDGAAPLPEPVALDGADAQAARRLAAGMAALAGADVREVVRAFPGPLLHIYGGLSQLVQARHVVGAPHHERCAVTGAGMRPQFDRPEVVAPAVTRFTGGTGRTREAA